MHGGSIASGGGADQVEGVCCPALESQSEGEGRGRKGTEMAVAQFLMWQLMSPWLAGWPAGEVSYEDTEMAVAQANGCVSMYDLYSGTCSQIFRSEASASLAVRDAAARLNGVWLPAALGSQARGESAKLFTSTLTGLSSATWASGTLLAASLTGEIKVVDADTLQELRAFARPPLRAHWRAVAVGAAGSSAEEPEGLHGKNDLASKDGRRHLPVPVLDVHAKLGAAVTAHADDTLCLWRFQQQQQQAGA
eukprot:jgi/Mesen1/5126/ME000255S04097